MDESKINYHSFSERDCSYGWDKYCSADKLKLCDSLDIICEIEIIDMYDKNGDPVEFNGSKETKETLIEDAVNSEEDEKKEYCNKKIIQKTYSSNKVSFDEITKITKYEWTIIQTNVNKFKQLPSGSSIKSSYFISEQNIKWYLECYPNGDGTDKVGSCDLFLTLLSLPPKYKSVTVYFYLYCPQTNSYFEDVDVFEESEDCCVWINASEIISTLQPDNDIVFECGVRILKITNRNKHIIYEYPLSVSSIKKNKQITWSINNNLINTFRKSQYGKPINARLISATNNMFTIECYPNGICKTSKGYISLYLKVISYPMGVESMVIKFNLKCPKMDESKINYHSFSNANGSYGWDKYCSANKLELCDRLDIICEIEIIEMYDKNGNAVEFNESTQETLIQDAVNSEE
eukprot:254185_1